jgi:hypothetical protein
MTAGPLRSVIDGSIVYGDMSDRASAAWIQQQIPHHCGGHGIGRVRRIPPT